jgi:hypothetical protein
MLQAGVKARKNLGQLCFDVAYGDALQVEALTAVLAVPGKSVQFLGSAPPFDHNPDAAGGTLRRVRDFRGKQIHFPFAYRHIH